jgi:hypothetical protein
VASCVVAGYAVCYWPACFGTGGQKRMKTRATRRMRATRGVVTNTAE